MTEGTQDWVDQSPALTAADCLNGYGTPEDGCAGPVEYRMALSGTGRSFPRCEAHWEERLRLDERLRQDYPDQDTPPAWFDPAAAGESWNDDY